MATLSVQSAAITGTSLTYNTASATTDSFANDGNTFALIKNSSGANAYTVTIPFPPEVTSTTATLTYSGSAPATDLTVAIFKRG
jgi:hypothetical protein